MYLFQDLSYLILQMLSKHPLSTYRLYLYHRFRLFCLKINNDIYKDVTRKTNNLLLDDNRNVDSCTHGTL